MPKKRWRESEVARDAGGRFATVADKSAVRRRSITALAEQRDRMEDRSDGRLRWGWKAVSRVWFIPKGGNRYWVPQQKKPAWIHGQYYIPGDPWPVDPNPDRVGHHPALMRLVPSDVKQAAEEEGSETGLDPGQSVRTEFMRSRVSLTRDQPSPKKGVHRRKPERYTR